MEEAVGDMLEADPVTSQDISQLHEVLKEFEIPYTTEESDDDVNMSLQEQSTEFMNRDEPPKMIQASYLQTLIQKNQTANNKV